MRRIDPESFAPTHDARLPQRTGVVRAVGSDAPARMLAPTLTLIFEEAQRDLGVGVVGEGTSQGRGTLEQLVERMSQKLGFELSTSERDEIVAQLEYDQKPFGILQSLADDPTISDIIITSYTKIAVQTARKNLHTDLAFPSADAYEAFVEKLLLRAGTTFSTKKPVADGMIGSFARVHAVHKVLCDEGPYLTIRFNRFARVTLQDLRRYGLAPEEVFDYLRGVVRAGQTVLLVGEVGTGKTTLARALASTIPDHESILVIEDTPEIRLEHPHVRYVRTREENTDGAGRVPPAECIRAGMRMAMNRIIFGEMRDSEAAEAFIDVCASGHPGLSTIHARSANEAITRLELFLGRAQKGVSQDVLSEQIVTAVQVIAFVDICRVTGRRRIMEVKEIGPVAEGVIRQRDIFRYAVTQGLPTWKVLTRVSAHRDVLENGDPAVVLSTFPGQLDLPVEVMYREAGERPQIGYSRRMANA